MRTLSDLKQKQSLPLEVKIHMAKKRIREWIDYCEDDTYISFSGGKDSTVLLDLVRQVDSSVKAIFCNTGLEYPEIVKFIKSQDNVEIIRPKMNFKDVIIKYGYPFISKEVSRAIYEARLATDKKYTYRISQLNGTFQNKNGGKTIYDYSKYKPLLKEPINFGNRCCNVMKKEPLQKHKNPMIAVLADESKGRTNNWVRYSCNIFNSKKPISRPLMIWTEQDILEYIKQNSLKIADVYGEIVQIDSNNQLCMYGGDLKCSGVQRTGCVFCGFGAHLDTQKGGISRFALLKKTHPKLYDYCMRGGEFVDGIWQPTNNGLGMAYVIDSLNRLYSKTLKNGKVKKFIEY